MEKIPFESGRSTRTVDYAPMLTTSGAGWTLGEIVRSDSVGPLFRYPVEPAEDPFSVAMSDEDPVTERLDAAEADLRAGRILGPFSSIEELLNAVEKRAHARAGRSYN